MTPRVGKAAVAGLLAATAGGGACFGSVLDGKRLWPGLAEFGMAFSGFVLGWTVAGVAFGGLGMPWILLVSPVITACAALFYAKVGPMWARASEEVDDDGDEPEIPQATRFERVPLRRVFQIIPLGILAALAGSIAVSALMEALGVQVVEQGAVTDIAAGVERGVLTLDATVLTISALLLAPAAEEWLFRGLLFSRVDARTTRWFAYLVSAVAFAAIHNNPTGFLVYLWLGVVFAAVLVRTGRLWAAIAVHVGNNAYVLAVLFFAG